MISNGAHFGAAGKYTVFEGVKLLEHLSWGVAGRSEAKLKQVLKEMGDKAAKDLSSIPIIIADVNDENSLQKMAERAKVINTYAYKCLFNHPKFPILYTHLSTVALYKYICAQSHFTLACIVKDVDTKKKTKKQ